MLSNSLPYADKLKDFFYEGLDRQTVGSIYRSAATGNWVPARSDLDLIILVPDEKLAILGQKVREWASTPGYPILDGYALSRSRGGLSGKRLDRLVKVAFPSEEPITLIDQWMIRNRSKHLFGNDSINSLYPEISSSQLSAWARDEINSLPSALVAPPQMPLSKVIWLTSWSARMLMLLKGTVCESKREALRWLADEHVEIKSLVCLLLENYEKSDEVPAPMTTEESAILRKFCLELVLQQKTKTSSATESPYFRTYIPLA